MKLKRGEKLEPIDTTKKKSKGWHQDRFQSIVTQNKIELKRKKYVVRSNIASLVRKYASYLFKEFRLDTKRNVLSF